MMDNHSINFALPDEDEYPAGLTEEYELLESLASEEGSETLLVKRKTDGLLCTAKCFTPESPLFNHPEPDILKKLHHPPLPEFVGEYKNETMRCALREYVPGQTLAERASDTSFSEEEVIRIGSLLCDQLTVLHSFTPPIIHRDIKPENVILRDDGQAVLIDFGISRQIGEDGDAPDTIPFGTRGFAPPEQYGFCQTDVRSDIFSLGTLLCWMLHGDIRLPKDASSPLDRVISQCTAFDPGRRYASSKDVKRCLIAAGEGSKLPEKTDEAELDDNFDSTIKRGRNAVGKLIFFAGAALFLIIAVVSAITGKRKGGAHFEEPLIEKAVRLNLGIADEEPLLEEQLSQAEGIYIVADRAYATSDEFYAGVNDWYAAGGRKRGTITSLNDIGRMSGLKQVCIAGEKITDLTPLSELHSLNKAEFKHNDIEDISVLGGMTDLTYVGINDNPVKDLTPLLDCPKLAFLDLCDVRNYDPSVIGELGNFDYLDLSNPTDSCRYLSGKSILSLRLAWSALTDLSDLSHVAKLEDLDISHTSVTDLSPLSVHKGLRRLNIASVPVEDLSVLLELPMLESVTISEDMRELADGLETAAFEIRVD